MLLLVLIYLISAVLSRTLLDIRVRHFSDAKNKAIADAVARVNRLIKFRQVDMLNIISLTPIVNTYSTLISIVRLIFGEKK